MSTATVQAHVEEPKALLTVLQPQIPAESTAGLRFVDDHPFAVMGIFIVISMALASGFVAALTIWLYQLRNSGVMDIKF